MRVLARETDGAARRRLRGCGGCGRRQTAERALERAARGGHPADPVLRALTVGNVRLLCGAEPFDQQRGLVCLALEYALGAALRHDRVIQPVQQVASPANAANCQQEHDHTDSAMAHSVS